MRLFPLVLLAGPGIQVARRLVKRRNLRPAFLISVGVASTLLIGALLPVMVYGSDIWSGFLDNSLGHARVPSMKRMGLGVISSFGLKDSVLGAPPAGGSFLWRRLGWVVGLLVAFVISSRFALVSLLGFVALSNLAQEVLPESRATYLVFSLGVLGVLAILSWQASRGVE